MSVTRSRVKKTLKPDSVSPPQVEEVEAPTTTEPITAVLRALRVLEALADSSTGLGFSDIVALLDVNKGIGLKILNSLLAARYIYRDDEAGVFRLTFKLSNLGLRKTASSHLHAQVSPMLRQYADETGELVRLAIVEGGCLTWIMSIPAKQRLLQVNAEYGYEIRPHIHAAGKAWLGTMPDDTALAIAEAGGMDAVTPNSLSSADALLKELHAVRKRGYALNYEEYSLGVCAIGAPIMVRSFSSQEECVGVITVAAPSARWSKAQLHEAAPRLIQVASDLANIWPLESTVNHGQVWAVQGK